MVNEDQPQISIEGKIKDIVLYHGSLAELNSQNPDIQYDLAKTRSGVDYFIKGYEDLSRVVDEIRMLVLRDGFSGLVNKRISHSVLPLTQQGLPNVEGRSSFIIGGTPIIRIRD